MKFTVVFVTLAMAVANVNASCQVSDITSVIFRAFAQGFQSNKKSVTSDCYIQTGQTMNKLDKLVSSVSPNVYSVGDWMRPLYNFQEILLESSKAISACQVLNAAKQLQTRTSTWPGVMDMLADIGSSVAKYYIATSGTGKYPTSYYTDPTEALNRSILVDAAIDVVNGKTCARQCRAAGIVLAELLSVQTPDAVFFGDLVFQLTNPN